MNRAIEVRNQAVRDKYKYKKQLAGLAEGTPEFDEANALYVNACAAMLYAERTLEGGFMEVGIEKEIRDNS